MRKLILLFLAALPMWPANNFYLSQATGSFNFSDPLCWKRSISGISKAAAAVVTSTAHGINLGGAGGTLSITISGATGTGWTAVNSTWTATVIDANTFSIPVDSTGFGTLGGTVTFTEGYPGDGDYTVWKSSGALTINASIGTVGGGGMKWIRAENGAVTATPGITITFGSTGSNPTGSGTATNPGADATMFGFLLAKLGAGGFTLPGLAASRIVITTADGSSPFYIKHQWGDFTGCTAITANVCNGGLSYNDEPLVSLAYTDVYRVGANVAQFIGMNFDGNANPTTTTTIDHCRFYSPYGIWYGGGTHTTFSFTFNTIYSPQYQYDFYVNSATVTAITLADNTEIVGATGVTGYLAYLANRPTAATIARNAIQNTATAARQIYSNNARATGNVWTAQNNLWVVPEVASAAGLCIGSAENLDRNVCQGTLAEPLYSYSGATITSSGNWISQWKNQASSQGLFITYGYAGSGVFTYVQQNNILVAENGDSTHEPMMILAYTSAGTNYIVDHFDHNTNVMPTYATGVQMAEGGSSTTGAIANSAMRSNIVVGGGASATKQVMDGNTHTTWDAALLYNGAGVHHNLTYGGNGVYSTMASTGFDNGSTSHPNALYGDLTVNPIMINTARRPCAFDLVLGGDGTCDDLFGKLATRALGSSGCTVCGTYVAAAGDLIEALRLWLFQGFQPTNLALKGMAHDGGDIGAVAITVYNTPSGIGSGGAAF